ncbi:MAG: hypothetical protein EOP57_00575 [Sphingomonadales bacterium]|nr:MAG: hypothetical protein EOP57_00575 [Sphingomonadales bacterium]
MKVRVIVIGLMISAVFSTSALAEFRKYTEVPNRDSCWSVEYVPRTVEVNTRGRLIRGERRSWTGEMVNGGIVRNERHAAVYEKVRRVVEEEHYSLDPQTCSARVR